MVRIRVFGELALELDGEDVPPPRGRPARALLGWLALHPGAHPRASVAARLWPDVLDSSARTSLRSALVRLTGALGAHADRTLVASRETVGLAQSPELEVDVAGFAALVEAGQLEEAWILGSGELLAGLEEEWVYGERDAHAARVADVLEQLAAREEGSGDLVAAAAWTRILAEREPLSEDAVRKLMRRLASTGDRGTALVAFERFRERLASQLAVGVSAETRSLAAELRTPPAVSVDTAGSDFRLPLPRLASVRADAVFVGRARELAQLRRAWEGAAGGEHPVVALAGHPGIGKTSVACELARSVHSDGAQVVFGRCYEQRAVPYQPFAEALGQLMAGLPQERLASWPALGAGELTRIVPDLASRVPGLEEPVAGDPDGARHRLLTALVAIIQQAVSATPTLFVIDDLHWADRPTLLALAQLARAPQRLPLLILVTFRRAEVAANSVLAEALDDLRRDRLLQRIVIDGMPELDIADLLERTTGRHPGSGLVRAVAQHTDGNPFFVTEIVREWAGDLPEGEETAATAALVAQGLPAGVREIIGRRLTRLSGEGQRVLRLAAVLGAEFGFVALGALADLDEESLLGALSEPLRARVVSESTDRPGRFAFHHALVRDVLYEGIPPTERALLHRKAATALDVLAGGAPDRPLAELAHHYGLAPRGDAARAAEYAEWAAERALLALAYEDAAAQFGRALALRPDAERAGRAELLLRLGEASELAGDIAGARKAFASAAELARELSAPALLARAALGFAGRRLAHIGQGEEREITLLREALTAVGEDERPLRARLLARLANAHYTDAQDKVGRLAEAALSEARATGDDQAVMAAIEAGLFSRWIPGGARERMQAASELVEVAERAGERDRAAEGLNWRIVAALELGEVAAADADIARYAELAAGLRTPTLLNHTGVHRAMRALLDGRLDEVEELALAALEAGRGSDDAAQLFGIQVFLLRDEQGRLGELVESLAAYAAVSREAPTWRLALAWALAETDRRDAARTELELIADNQFSCVVRDVSWPSAMSLAARLCYTLGDAGNADVVHSLLSPFAALHVISAHAAYSGPVEHHLGLTAMVVGHLTDAIEHFEKALAVEESIGAKAWTAHTGAAMSAALAGRGRAGDASAARALRGACLATAKQLGMTRLQEQLMDG